MIASRPQHPGRLFNPNTDPIPSRSSRAHHHQLHRDNIEVDSDASSGVGPSSRAATHGRRRAAAAAHPPPPPQAAQQSTSSPHQQLPQQPPPTRQLFDPRHDDPLRFHALTRGAGVPSKPPSGGYISASATSASDAQSLGSNLTLTSNTTSSSASNPYSPGNSRDLGGNRLWYEQMKRMYRDIAHLEEALLKENVVVEEDVDSRHSVMVQPSRATEERWPRLVREHKQLAELCHNFLSFALKPQVPASLQTLPAKYNIPARLWNHGFQRLLMALRRASSSSIVALEQLSSLIIYAYGFYTSLLEEENLAQFRILWLEALGDLSRYQMAVIAHVQEGTGGASSSKAAAALAATAASSSSPPSSSPGVSRMEESPLPSIGAHAAAELELEDDRELWRRNAREWYTKGIKDTPGQGRLHHHLGLVSADAEGEELRAVYHFAKSLVSHHPCDAARESILPLFSVAKQSARYSPSSPAPSIFLLLQGMLFTRIQLDDFYPTVARLRERIQLNPEEVTEAEWTMMAMLNISAIMDYGRGEGVLRKVCGWMSSSSAGGLSAANGQTGVPKPTSSRTGRPASGRRGESEDAMQVDSTTPGSSSTTPVVVVNEPEVQMADAASSLQGPMEALSTSRPPAEELPYTAQLALHLTFELLLHTMRHPYIRSKSPFRPDSVNPYLTTVFTFLATVFRNEIALQILEKHVPWNELTPFFTQIYQKTTSSRSGSGSVHLDDEGSKTSKWFGSAPLPEDWCLRGSEWVRRVYERGFWRTSTSSSSSKSEAGITSEMDVLIPPVCPQDDDLDGAVEGENDAILNVNWTDPRYKRLRWSVETIVRSVDGLIWLGEGREKCVGVVPPLLNKVEMWMAEKQREAELERQRMERMARMTRPYSDSMEVDEEDMFDEDEDEDDPRDSEEVRALKARRRYLRSLQSPAVVHRSRPAPRPSRKAKPNRPLLQVAPGYTILVCDTNILLGSLPMVSELVASGRWTFVVPLAVVTELDGLSNQPTDLGRAAAEALTYLITAVQTQSTSLKVQTSKGNYLKSLSIRSEATTLGEGERNMDDLIVRSALWQLDHFVDRTGLLIASRNAVKRTDKTSKVVLLTFDRMMRVKARSRQLDAADEKDMAAIFGSAKY
ncbi:hypothetical protein M407DRAFT_63790 [Tulasnella calospora MUT 4182]|uniref:PIN domain-containing protein n=1 Tax=Tulasnella calospora MUT 4182 TaxID=1051891 RepID=A0A0C3QNF4_9AGAM|nr:hypothetical protein M407DRAFT_63790 [Tulasnella calospora MUT 4182]